MSTAIDPDPSIDAAMTELKSVSHDARANHTISTIAPDNAVRWRSSAEHTDVRDHEWNRAPLRTHQPARRAA